MIEIEFNTDTLTPALARVATAMGDMTPVMREIAELLLSTQDRMQKGESPDGTSFAPRSPVTLERSAALGFSFGAPLNLTGEMRSQLATEVGADYARIGSNAIQAAVMQFGADQGAFDRTSRSAPIPWGDIPARPFLGLSDEDEANIIVELEGWRNRVAEGIARHFPPDQRVGKSALHEWFHKNRPNPHPRSPKVREALPVSNQVN